MVNQEAARWTTRSQQLPVPIQVKTSVFSMLKTNIIYIQPNTYPNKYVAETEIILVFSVQIGHQMRFIIDFEDKSVHKTHTLQINDFKGQT